MRNIFRRLLPLLLCLLLLPLSGIAEQRLNMESGYNAVIEDGASLLAMPDLVMESMLPITEYANVAFVTTSNGGSSWVTKQAQAWGDRRFGASTPYTVFLIDMGSRQLGIYSSKSIYGTLTTAKTQTITDNVYRYASRGDYDGCAIEAFTEMESVLRGEKISEPMKITSNILIALILSILLSYLLISTRMQHEQRTSLPTVIKAAGAGAATLVTGHVLAKVVRHESGSGGGHGGFGGGGGGGFGGGGGGGSHGF